MNQKINYFMIPGIKPIHRNIKFDVIEGDRIIEVVCQHFNTDIERLKRKGRFAEVVLARNTLCYFLFKYTALNKAQIARMLKKDHTTVVHGLRAFEIRIEMEDAVKGHVIAIKEKLFGR